MLSKQVVWISAGMFLVSLSLGCGGGSEEPSSEGGCAQRTQGEEILRKTQPQEETQERGCSTAESQGYAQRDPRSTEGRG